MAPLVELLEGFRFELHRWCDAHLVGRFFCTERLIYTERKFVQGLWWTPFTYMAVHGSYSHLLGNLTGLAFAGRRPWVEWGPLGFYGVFLSGGAFAALNSSTKSLKLKKEFGSWLAVPQFFPLSGQWRASAERAFSDVSSRLASQLQPHMRFVGCSAGVASLSGANLAMNLRDLYECLWLQSQEPNAWCVGVGALLVFCWPLNHFRAVLFG